MRSLFIRSLALFTALAFAGTSVTYTPSLWAQTAAISTAVEIAGLSRLPVFLKIPAELGTLEDFEIDPVETKKHPLIIHIQDAHSQPEAQKKIAEILRYLSSQIASATPQASSRNDGRRILVALEGAEGEIHPEYLDLVPGARQINETVVEDLLSKGELSGAEKFAWGEYRLRHDDSQHMRFVGVEDPELYRENLKTYRNLIFQQEEIETLLNPARSGLERDQSRTFSPELRHFLRERTRRKEGNYGGGSASPQLAAYVDFLTAEARKRLGIDLADPFEQLRFPQLVRLLVLGRLSKELNATRANEEEEKVLKTLRKKARAGEDKELLNLLESIESSRDPRAIAEAAWEFAARYQIRLADYPEYLKGLGIVILEREMEPARLFEEMGQIEKLILEKLATQKEEKELLEKLEKFSMLEKLLRLELTREEYQSLLKRTSLRGGAPDVAEAICGSRDCFVGSRQKAWRGAPRNDDKALKSFVSEAMKFYQGAEARERVLLEKTLAALAASENSPADLAILVTGGFHTAGLTEGLNERKINYAVLRPRFTAAPEENLYAQVLRNEQAELPGSLHQALPSKQQALLLKGLLEQALPFLVEKLRLPHAEAAEKLADAINRHPILIRSLEAVARTFSDHSTVRILIRSRIENSPAVSHGKASPPPHAIPDALLLGGAYETLRGEQTISDSVLGLEVTLDAAHRFRLIPLALKKTKFGGMTVESGPIEALKPGLFRSEVRTGPVPSSEIAQMTASDPRLQWLVAQGYEVVDELPREPNRRVISLHIDSELIPLERLIRSEEAYRHLSENKLPPLIFGLGYSGLARAKEPTKEEERKNWREIQTEGRAVTFIPLMQGVHELGPEGEKNAVLFRYPYIDDEILEIIQEQNALRYPEDLQSVAQLPIFHGEPTLQRLIERYRKIQERSPPEPIADLPNRLWNLAFRAIFRQYLRRFGPQWEALRSSDETWSKFRALHSRLQGDSFIVTRYTSDYANAREFVIFLEALDRARKSRGFPAQKPVIVLTFLDPKKLYKGEALHGQVYRLLEGETVENERLTVPVNFYDFLDREHPRFPAKEDPGAITVVNLRANLPSPLFSRLFAYSDVAVAPGDKTLELGVALSRTGVGPQAPFGPVVLMQPHPSSLNGIQKDLQSFLSAQFKGTGYKGLAKDTLRTMDSYFDLQKPKFPLQPNERETAINELARILVPADGARGYRFIFGKIVAGGNMFDLIVDYVRRVEAENPSALTQILETSPPATAWPERSSGLLGRRGTDPPLALKRHWLILTFHDATVGKGDAGFTAQLARVFGSLVSSPGSFFIHLADENLETLKKSMGQLEEVAPNTEDFNFLFITQDSLGRFRYLRLKRNRAEVRSEVRTIGSELISYPKGLPGDVVEVIQAVNELYPLGLYGYEESDKEGGRWEREKSYWRPWLSEEDQNRRNELIDAILKRGASDYHLFHGNLVQDSEGWGTLILGATASGKSNLTYYLVKNHGYRFLGDGRQIGAFVGDHLLAGIQPLVGQETEGDWELRQSLLYLYRRVGPEEKVLETSPEFTAPEKVVPVKTILVLLRETPASSPSKDELIKIIDRFHQEPEVKGFSPLSNILPRLSQMTILPVVVPGKERSWAEQEKDFAEKAAETAQLLSGSRSEIRSPALADNTDIGHIVEISPEIAPFSQAGGLAVVLRDRPRMLARAGIPVSVITLLYHETQGKKHSSAEELLREGIEINGQRVRIERTGKQVRIPFGKVTHWVTGETVLPREEVTAEVFRAEIEGVTVYFLYHPKIADALYRSYEKSSVHQLKQSILLSRGALEVMREFDLSPNFILANDWMAAPTLAYLRAHPGYASYVRFQNTRLGFVVHNLEEKYQFRPFTNENQMKIFDLLDLGGEHFFGLANKKGEKDEEHPDHLNLLRGGVFHADFVQFVSQGYLLESLTPERGEGVEDLFFQKRPHLYGVSNGIDTRTIRWRLDGIARALLGEKPVSREKFGEEEFLARIAGYKQAVKGKVQEDYGLIVDPHAELISLAGRLVDQKGVLLLAEEAQAILDANPKAQLLVGGPVANGDPDAALLREVVSELEKDPRYQGRIAGKILGPNQILDFDEVLTILLASDLFLMPSKWEPGGITQLEGEGAGAVVVARRTGGIASTLVDYDVDPEKGTAFLFDEYSGEALREAVSRAMGRLSEPGVREKLIHRTVREKNDWADRLPDYRTMFLNEAGRLDGSVPDLEPYRTRLPEVAVSRAEVRSEDEMTREEIETGVRYWEGKLGTTPIERPFRASQKDDVKDINDLSGEEAMELERLGVESLVRGEGYLFVLAAGAAARMSPKDTPSEVFQMAEGRQPLSKAAVPVGRDTSGKVATYLSELGLNVSRLLNAIDAEAKRAGRESRVWENYVGLFTREDLLQEQKQLLSEGSVGGGGLLGSAPKHIRFIYQPLSAKFVATPKEVEEYKMKEKFRTDQEYQEALAYSRSIEERFTQGDQRAVIFEGEKDPWGHGEFFHQLVASGELARLVRSGKKWIAVRNIDNLGAKYDKAWLRTLGMFLKEGLDFQPEVSPRTPGQKGGSLIVMTDDGSHQLAEDPAIEKTNEVRKARGEAVMKLTDPRWLNDAVGILTPKYVINLDKDDDESDEKFIERLEKASPEERQAIAHKGRQKFPTLIDPKPAQGKHVLVVKPETNMWQSTGVAGPESRQIKIKAVGVRGVRNLPADDYFDRMSNDERMSELARMRFFSTKNWTKSEAEVQKAREEVENAGGKISDLQLRLSLETYVWNRPLVGDLLRYNREAELVTPGILRAEVRATALAVDQVFGELAAEIQSGAEVDVKTKRLDKFQGARDRNRLFRDLSSRLNSLAEDWKSGKRDEMVPQWKRFWWAAKAHAVLRLINQKYLDLKPEARPALVEEEEKAALDLMAKARESYFIETGRVKPFRITKDRKELYRQVLQAFGGGVRIRTRVSLPPNTGFEASTTLAAALMMALLTLRKDPEARSVKVTAGLRLQTSSAGGSENFDWSFRQGMTLVHFSFYLDGKPVVEVEVERLPRDRLVFESEDLNVKEIVSEKLYPPSGNGDPLRYLKTALAFAASLPENQSTDSWSISYLGSILEGLPEIRVFGGISNIAPILGGLRFTANEAGAYEPTSEAIVDGDVLKEFQAHSRLFDPGFTKKARGKVSTAGRQTSRTLRLLVNDSDILWLMKELRLTTIEMKDFILKKDYKELAIAMNNVQIWTNKAIGEDTPEPLNWLIEELKKLYQRKSGGKPLGVLVQGAGPIGGVLIVGERVELVDQIMKALLPEYEQRLEAQGLLQKKETGNRPRFLDFEITEKPMTVTKSYRSELRENIFASRLPTAALLEEAGRSFQRKESLDWEAPLRSEVRDSIAGIAWESGEGIYAEVEKGARQWGMNSETAFRFVLQEILEKTGYAQGESGLTQQDWDRLGLSREMAVTGLVPSRVIVRFTEIPDLESKAWDPFLRLLASQRKSALTVEIEGVTGEMAERLEDALTERARALGQTQISVYPVGRNEALHAESEKLISRGGLPVGLVSPRRDLLDAVPYRRGLLRVDVSHFSGLNGILASAFLAALSLKDASEEIYLTTNPEALAPSLGVEFGSFLAGYELLAEAKAEEYIATQA